MGRTRARRSTGSTAPATSCADLRLEPDEMRALQVAVAATRTGSDLGQEAMWKLGSGVIDREAAVVATMPSLPGLPLLRDAIARRATVEFVVPRRRPHGRTVRVAAARRVLVPRRVRPHARRTADVPCRPHRRADHDGSTATSSSARPASTCVRCCPTTRRCSAPTATRRRRSCASTPSRAAAVVARARRRPRRRTSSPNGDVDVRVPCANREAFRSWVLGLIEHAEVRSPADVRADIVEWLERQAAG